MDHINQDQTGQFVLWRSNCVPRQGCLFSITAKMEFQQANFMKTETLECNPSDAAGQRSRPELHHPATLRKGNLLLMGGAVAAILFAAVALHYFVLDAASLKDFLQQLRTEYRQLVPEPFRQAVYPYLRFVLDNFLNPVFYLAISVVFFLERILPANRKQKFFSTGFLQDLTWFCADGIIQIGLLSLYAEFLHGLFQQQLSFLTIQVGADWPLGVRIVLSLVVFEFFHWLHHWVRHKVRVLWYFHAVHHSQREMNLFTDSRLHPVDRIVMTTFLVIPFNIFLIHPTYHVLAAFLLIWYARVYHANIRTNYGFLKHILVTPQSHRIHHSIRPEHADKNFGTLLTIWDRVFGTLYKNYDEYPETGLADEAFPFERSPRSSLKTWFAQFIYPFRMILGRSYQPPETLMATGTEAPSDGTARSR